jgi:thiol-disulfide isomerase/thioredoxin
MFAALLFTFLAIGGCAAQERDPKQVLAEATNALVALKMVSYDFTYEGSGSLAGHFSGDVRILKGATPAETRLGVTMAVPAVHGGSEDPQQVEIALSGGNIQVKDEARRTFTTGTMSGGSAHLMSYAYYAVLFQFMQPAPFETELADSLLSYQGTATVDGVQCDVVKASNNTYGGADITWFIGRDDHLPHAQVWEVTTPGVDGRFRFEIRNLNPNAVLSIEDFSLAASGEWTLVDEDARNIGVGAPAPAWTLDTADGGSLSLDDLRGEVVVLDFFASWCTPCWQLMPEFERVAKQFEGRPVRFYGVNAWESPGTDPRAYMKEKGISYPVLLNGETIAQDYKIGSLPVLYVIDRKGRVTYVSNPVLRAPNQTGAELKAAIEKALEG